MTFENPPAAKKEDALGLHCERCGGNHETEECALVKHEAEFRAEDLATMNQINEEIGRAFDILPNQPRSDAAYAQFKFAISEVLPDQMGILRGRVTSKIGPRDFISVAKVFIDAYPGTPQAERMQQRLWAVEDVLQSERNRNG